jgi:hypothetical protein
LLSVRDSRLNPAYSADLEINHGGRDFSPPRNFLAYMGLYFSVASLGELLYTIAVNIWIFQRGRHPNN